MRTGRLLPAAVVALAGLVGLCAGCGGDDDAGPGAVSTGPTFVEDAACIACHAAEHAAWQRSDHDLAMQHATPETVLGDFGDVEVEEHGVVTRFSRDGDRFLVHTEGPDGEMGDFEVKYTFGVRPLQQYLIEVDRGHVQCLQISWDVERRRWIPMFEERIDPDDPLHWTSHQFGWNFMCAECHSTDVRKGYDLERDAYDTTFHEIDVGCQACHGPGSAHVAWAERAATGAASDTPPDGESPFGLLVDLGSDALVQVEACARCHSRRSVVKEPYEYGHRLLDHHEPALLRDTLYHADGQILDEVFVYGSFAQTSMYAHGVRCTDCHDPHTARLLRPGDATCTECHQLEPPERFPDLEKRRYDSRRHHHHEPGNPGSACVDCHMPETTYMQVDPRRDHSFRVPRPDLAARLGTPDVCTGCHVDREPSWAAETVAGWRASADLGPPEPHFAEAFAAARRGAPGAAPMLVALVDDDETPGIVKATAIELLASYRGEGVGRVVRESLTDGDGLVRLAAIRTLDELLSRPIPEPLHADVAALLAPRLSDELRAVRASAARVLARLASLPEAIRPAYDRAFGEYLERQRAQEDRPGGHLNLGALLEDQGRPAEAEAAYRTALRLDPHFAPARFNLATLLGTLDRLDEARTVLEALVADDPTDADGHYALGLVLAELGALEAAAEALEAAIRHGRRDPRVHYNLGLLFDRLDRPRKAEGHLLAAHRADPTRPDVLHALTLHYRRAGRLVEAEAYARRLVEQMPGAPGPRELLEAIEAERGR